MTGYDEAAAWLKENAPDWRMQSGTVSLIAGLTIGAPTGLRVEVVLIPLDERDRDAGAMVIGEGNTYIQAVQNAVGGLR